MTNRASIFINFDINIMKILVTGCAGFIGSHTCERLLKDNYEVIGLDNLDDYYDVSLKYTNLNLLKKYQQFTFIRDDIRTTNVINDCKPEKIIHLASMAGVRYSIQNPHVYVSVNIDGFINILEQAKTVNVKQIVYASSSSVYGLNSKVPFSESDPIVSPNSPYASSKKAMELFAQTYSQLYNLNIIGLRFFTVYGPRGRPDMAPYKFLNAIKNELQFYKYGDGSSSRDYTYIDDIIDGVIASMHNTKKVKCEIYNLGNSSPITLNDFIKTCESVVNKKAKYIELENQLGDVQHTFADISKAQNDLGFFPKTKLHDGLKKMLNQV